MHKRKMDKALKVEKIKILNFFFWGDHSNIPSHILEKYCPKWYTKRMEHYPIWQPAKIINTPISKSLNRQKPSLILNLDHNKNELSSNKTV